MSFSWTRVGAILRKELRDYRRNRFVIATMAATPLLFITLPMIQLIAANVTGTLRISTLRIGLSLLYMLVIPVIMPSVVSAYSVVGEREQGTLEPVLTTPIRREEFLIGKALAAFVPTVVIAYAVFGIFLARCGAVRPSGDRFGRSTQERTSWCSCCSRRCSPVGRSGSGSRSPPGRRMCAPRNS